MTQEEYQKNYEAWSNNEIYDDVFVALANDYINSLEQRIVLLEKQLQECKDNKHE